MLNTIILFIFIKKELANVMTSLGACPPWAVLENMIDAADSDRNGKVKN